MTGKQLSHCRTVTTGQFWSKFQRHQSFAVFGSIWSAIFTWIFQPAGVNLVSRWPIHCWLVGFTAQKEHVLLTQDVSSVRSGAEASSICDGTNGIASMRIAVMDLPGSRATGPTWDFILDCSKSCTWIDFPIPYMALNDHQDWQIGSLGRSSFWQRTRCFRDMAWSRKSRCTTLNPFLTQRHRFHCLFVLRLTRKYTIQCSEK